MKFWAVLMFAVILSTANAQSYTEQIAEQLEKGNVAQAKVLIDSAMLDTVEVDLAVRYFQGYVYRELFLENKDLKAKEYGDIAIEAFAKCMELDAAGTYGMQGQRLLVDMLSQYFNEAIVNVTARNYAIGQVYFDVYEEYMPLIDAAELKKAQLKFYRILGNTYTVHARESAEGWEFLYTQAIEAYREMVKLNTQSFTAHFNSGTICYAMSERFKKESEVESFEWLAQAAVHFETAEELEVGGTQAIEALINVYKDTNDTVRVAHYKEKLKAAKK